MFKQPLQNYNHLSKKENIKSHTRKSKRRFETKEKMGNLTKVHLFYG